MRVEGEGQELIELVDAALAALDAQYTPAAVEQAVRQRYRRRRRGGIEPTRQDRERMNDLWQVIGRRYDDHTFNFFAFIEKQKRAEIPTKVTIEILDRIAKVKPDNPWALVETIMAKDYPGHNWGRGPQGRMLRVEG